MEAAHTASEGRSLHALPQNVPEAGGAPLSLWMGFRMFLVVVPPLLAILVLAGSGLAAEFDETLRYAIELRTGESEPLAGVSPAFVLALAASVVWVLAGAASVSRRIAREIGAAASWVRESREHAFEQASPLPAASSREMRTLMREIGAAASYFSESEKRHAYLLKQKEEFVTIAAHQLRTPLTGLEWGFASLQKQDLSDEDRRMLEASVQESLQRMLVVVNGLLQVASLEEGRAGFVFEKTDIGAIVAKVVEEYREAATKKQVALDLEQPAPVPAVRADAERISFAISSLVSNAVNYTGQGGRITVSVVKVAGGVEVAVEDTGIGISEQDLLQIPLKFYRSEMARSMHPNGSGLGLYTARNIIEKHGGSLSIRSKEGAGTRVSFAVPFSA